MSLVFPFSYKETEIHTMCDDWYVHTGSCVFNIHALNCRNLLGSQNREASEMSLAPGLLLFLCRGTANSNTDSLWLLSLSTEAILWWSLPRALIITEASKACQRAGLQPVSLSLMTNKNSLHPFFISESPISMSMQLLLCRPSRKQNNNIIEC